MPTWEETRDHLRATYKLLHDDAAWMGIGFAFMRDGKALHQRVRVEPRDIYGVPGVMAWCDVVPVGAVPAEKVLQRNMAFRIGALAAHEGLLVLVATLPLDGVVFGTFDKILEHLARDAASLREDAPPAS
ncbi:MAG: hypothetical protein H6708_17575 [Kofleriaceae bacterium]|nr:hypothetical protein [Myxococcales bacterium]MCB9562218.1 hypothetical protein [Kofleriaceae bacterium]